MKMMEDMTWDELTEHLTQYIHSGLLEGGGKKMRDSVSCAMQLALRWRAAQDQHPQK